jgi:hypothetical protein
MSRLKGVPPLHEASAMIESMYEYRQDVDIQVVCLGLGGVVSSGGSSRTAREEDDGLDS